MACPRVKTVEENSFDAKRLARGGGRAEKRRLRHMALVFGK